MKITQTKGLSLVEMMIVLAILGLVGVIASFNWKHYKNNADLRTMARALELDIENTKQKAVSEGKCYRITINSLADGNNYSIARGNVASCSTSTFAVISTMSPSTLGLEGSGLEIKTPDYGGGDTINFETRGTILSGGSVVLENSIHSQATVSSNITGKTYVTFNMR